MIFFLFNPSCLDSQAVSLLANQAPPPLVNAQTTLRESEHCHQTTMRPSSSIAVTAPRPRLTTLPHDLAVPAANTNHDACHAEPESRQDDQIRSEPSSPSPLSSPSEAAPERTQSSSEISDDAFEVVPDLWAIHLMERGRIPASYEAIREAEWHQRGLQVPGAEARFGELYLLGAWAGA